MQNAPNLTGYARAALRKAIIAAKEDMATRNPDIFGDPENDPDQVMG